MIELTHEQRQTIERESEKPTVVVDTHTGQQYRLIKEEIYGLVCGTLRPFGRGWDDSADDDLIRQHT